VLHKMTRKYAWCVGIYVLAVSFGCSIFLLEGDVLMILLAINNPNLLSSLDFC
jgi:hypothetical protein